MPSNLPTDEEVRNRLRETMHPLIKRNPALAADVIPLTLAEAIEIVRAFRVEIERLEAQLAQQWMPLESEPGAWCDGYEHKMCRRNPDARES